MAGAKLTECHGVKFAPGSGVKRVLSGVALMPSAKRSLYKPDLGLVLNHTEPTVVWVFGFIRAMQSESLQSSNANMG